MKRLRNLLTWFPVLGAVWITGLQIRHGIRHRGRIREMSIDWYLWQFWCTVAAGGCAGDAAYASHVQAFPVTHFFHLQ